MIDLHVCCDASVVLNVKDQALCVSAGIDLSKENQVPGTVANKLQRQSVDDWSVVDLASEHDCNQNRATFKPIPENKAQARHSFLIPCLLSRRCRHILHPAFNKHRLYFWQNLIYLALPPSSVQYMPECSVSWSLSIMLAMFLGTSV